MAKKTGGEKKKRKGIVQRMMFGNDNKPDLTPEQMNTSKWALFKYLFGSRFGTMIALNMLTLLFAVPGIIVGVLFYLNIGGINTYIPYSSNLGLGYPVVTDAVSQGMIVTFDYTMMEYLSLVPCIGVLALGIAGNLYVLRKLIWEEPTSTFKDFFRGIKKCWLPSFIIGLAFGFTLLLFIFTLNYFDVYGLNVALKATCVTLSSILLVFMSLFTPFFMTQNVAFKMSPIVLIRNSVLFVVGTNIRSVIFFGIAVAPALLFLIPGAVGFIAMIFAFLGFSFATVVITLFCHHCYGLFLYDKIEGKPALYQRRPTDIDEERQKEIAKKNKQPVPYKNPKKRKKSIDEGAGLTPLAPTFRREDLERLEQEHKRIMEESEVPEADDDELGEIDDNDNADDFSEELDENEKAELEALAKLEGIDEAEAVFAADGAKAENDGKTENE